MADAKISALTNLTAADAINDMIPIVDVSDTPPASGNTKRISINNILSSSPTASGALTVTGLVTAGSATITGDLTVDTSTLKVDSTNNRVGIGTATPANTFQVIATTGIAADFAGTGAAGFQTIARIRTASANSNGFLIQGNNTTDETFLNNFYNGALVFGVNNTEGMRLNTTANLVLKGGTAAANGVGVTFPAVQVASSDANCLDDYEEGTFTPIISGATTAGSGTYTYAVGRYTKVGRIVHFQLRVAWTAHTGTGNMIVDGLPFTSSSVTNSQSSVSIGFFNNITLTASNVATAFVAEGQTSIAFYQYPVGGGTAGAVGIDTAGDIMFSGSYTV